MTKHAVLSPSSAKTWMICAGSVALCASLKKRGSRFAAEGSVGHTIASTLLEFGECDIGVGCKVEHDGFEIEVTQDLMDAVLAYVEDARAAIAEHPFAVEQRVPIGHLTGDEGAEGTADLLIFRPRELEVRDAKFGRGVEVDADDNWQLQLYALGALEKFGPVLDDIEQVRGVIHQPRKAGPKEVVWSMAEMDRFAEKVRAAGNATREPDAPLVPSDEGCRWCPAKATCPALRAQIEELTLADFCDLDQEELPDPKPVHVGLLMHKVPLVEAWCKAVRGEVERLLFDGENVPGWKLVQGRKGPRKWSSESEQEVAQVLGDQAYRKELISPTEAAKIVKGDAERAKALESLITQSPGKASVAPESDPRPATSASASADEFSDEVDA